MLTFWERVGQGFVGYHGSEFRFGGDRLGQGVLATIFPDFDFSETTQSITLTNHHTPIYAHTHTRATLNRNPCTVCGGTKRLSFQNSKKSRTGTERFAGQILIKPYNLLAQLPQV